MDEVRERLIFSFFNEDGFVLIECCADGEYYPDFLQLIEDGYVNLAAEVCWFSYTGSPREPVSGYRLLHLTNRGMYRKRKIRGTTDNRTPWSWSTSDKNGECLTSASGGRNTAGRIRL